MYYGPACLWHNQGHEAVQEVEGDWKTVREKANKESYDHVW